MRKLFLVLIIAGLVLSINFPANSTPTPSFPKVSDWEVYPPEAYTAFYVNDSDESDVKPDPEPVDCPCNGTGKIRSGDGLIEFPCPCVRDGGECKCAAGTCKCKGTKQNCDCEDCKCTCGCDGDMSKCDCEDCKCCPCNGTKVNCTCDDCKCVKDTQPDKTNLFADSDRNYMVIYIGADWCGPCRDFKANSVPSLKQRRWTTDNITNPFYYSFRKDVRANVMMLDYDKDLYELNQLSEFLGYDVRKSFRYQNEQFETKLPTFLMIDIKEKRVRRYHLGYLSANAFHNFYHNL